MTVKKNSKTKKAEPNFIKVSADMLPVSCPLEESDLWNKHPMVYIPLNENNKEISCPYCSIVYRLEK